MLRAYVESPRRQRILGISKKEKFEKKRNLGLSPFVKFVVKPEEKHKKLATATMSNTRGRVVGSPSAISTTVGSPVNNFISLPTANRKSFLFSG